VHTRSGLSRACVIPADPGTYALLMHLAEDLILPVGKLGDFQLRAGLYVYVGSALGAGGVDARLAYHLRQKQRAHWHIDSLTQQCAPQAACWIIGAERLECSWTQSLLGLPETRVPILGFGSSDCVHRCLAHLVALGSGSALSDVAQAMSTRAAHSCTFEGQLASAMT
jgi:Uri superfamily endonuclease